MNMRPITRRAMIKQAWVCAGLALSGSNPLFSERAAASSPGFKIGAVDWELTKAADPEALAVAARLGFDGLQVDLGDVEAMKRPEMQDRYEQLTRKYPVEIASLALGKLSDVPYGADPKGQVLVDSAVGVARSMRQKLLLLAFFGRNGFDREENKAEHLVGRLKENAREAEKAGVILGLEGEASVERYRELIDQVGSPAVKVYFDCVHAHQEGRDIAEEIGLLGDRICGFHAKDYGNILFGKGKIDFARVRRGMDKIGYRGWIQVEQWNEIDGEKPLGFIETHRRNLQYLRKIFPPSL
jgi:L-ribulose-5-phosphate 3-epimerase